MWCDIKMGKKTKKVFYKLLPGLLWGICFLSAGCSAGEEEESREAVVIERQEETVEYMTVPVKREDVIKTAKLRCMYNHTDEEEISIPVKGNKVEEICVQVGDRRSSAGAHRRRQGRRYQRAGV